MFLVAESQCVDPSHCAGLLQFNATLVVQLAVFVVTAAVLWILVWGPITSVLDERHRRIDRGLRAADEATRRLAGVRQEVEAMLAAARQTARDQLAAAHRDASIRAERERAAARAAADEELTRARLEIREARDRAHADLQGQVTDLVQAATARLLGRPLDLHRYRDAIMSAPGGSS